MSHQGRAYIVQQDGLLGFLKDGIIAWIIQNNTNVGPLGYLQDNDRVDLVRQLKQEYDSNEARIAFLKTKMVYFPVFLGWLRANGKIHQGGK